MPLSLPRVSAFSSPVVLVEFVEDELVEREVVVGEVVVGEVVVVEGEAVVCEAEPDPPPEPDPVPAAKATAAVPSTKVPASVNVRRCFIVIYSTSLVHTEIRE
jgi:hypothetical protein